MNKELVEAGCDEAGRGCLAGPVCAAAVILPENFRHKLLNDSKQVNLSARLELKEIIEKKAVAYSVAFITNQEIDKLNILRASIFAMHKAIEKLTKQPEWLLIDGNRFYKYKEIPHTCVIQGDGKYKSIAAASILAKTYRDEYMEKLSREFPHFAWHSNKGYPTEEHRNAIVKYGISPYHRRSFNLFDRQLQMDLGL
ncbi:MAG: ribonuclease HII [Bacteroidota bacterium]